MPGSSSRSASDLYLMHEIRWIRVSEKRYHALLVDVHLYSAKRMKANGVVVSPVLPALLHAVHPSWHETYLIPLLWLKEPLALLLVEASRSLVDRHPANAQRWKAVSGSELVTGSDRADGSLLRLRTQLVRDLIFDF